MTSPLKVKAPNVAASRGQEKWRAPLYSLLILIAFVLFWQFISTPSVDGRTEGLPGPIAVIGKTVTELAHPFRNNGLNDQGIGFQMIASLTRVAYGYIMAAIVAILGGVALGLSPTLFRAFNPFIQLLKPVSPLAWMPLFLYTIKDSNQAIVLVIFMSSLWPTLANTAFGVANIRTDHLRVAALLQLTPWQRLFQIILPAAAPNIIAGLRISLGAAWIAIVAAEMLVGNKGIGYFLWNEWNNLSLTSVMFSILMIGSFGFALDALLGWAAKRVVYAD